MLLSTLRSIPTKFLFRALPMCVVRRHRIAGRNIIGRRWNKERRVHLHASVVMVHGAGLGMSHHRVIHMGHALMAISNVHSHLGRRLVRLGMVHSCSIGCDRRRARDLHGARRASVGHVGLRGSRAGLLLNGKVVHSLSKSVGIG
jgi:hypothetical protein